MRDSFEIYFTFKIAEGYDCGFFCAGPLGRAEGFALVIQNGASNAKGSSGDPGQGYKNIPGKSFAVVIDSYGAGTATRTIGFYRGGGMENSCRNTNTDGCTSGYILRETGFDGSSYDFVEKNVQGKLIYDGIRHLIFFKINTGGSWLTAIQAPANMEQIFGTSVDSVRIGFTASNGNLYYDTTRIKSLRFRQAQLNSGTSVVLENGRTVGAVHDDHSKPFKLTIDGKDVCNHDRAVGGESISVRLLHTVQSSVVVTVPTECGGTTAVGICPKTLLNPGSHPVNQQVGGLHEVRFLTTVSGFYDVELTAGGTTSVMGRVYVAE